MADKKKMEDQEEWSEPELEYRVPEGNMGWLDKKFKRMSKIAREVGADPPTYEILRSIYSKHMVPNTISPRLDDEWDGTFDKFNYIRIHGEPPKLAGWSFIATLTHTKDGNLLNKVPGIVEDLPEKYRTAGAKCDYCSLSRKRSDSFIVRKDKTGEYSQVGRNCLAKFLGYSNPERVASYATMLAGIADAIGDEEEKLFSSGGRSDYRGLEDFLTMVAAVVREKGWISKAKAQEREGLVATVHDVQEQLLPPTGREAKYFVKITPTEADKEKAKEVITFARSDKLITDTDYKHNLKVSTAGEYFHIKAAGIVASLIAFQDRDKEWELEQVRRKEEAEERKKARQAEYQSSEYVGAVGDRITVTVKVIFHKEIGGEFGITHLYKMRDGDGNAFTWFSSNDVLEEGKHYALTGTVKKHETYEGVKQTIITRCKAVEVDEVVEKADDESITELPSPVKSTSASQRRTPSRRKGQSQPTSVGGIRK